eukprot:7620495-Alexandrium_andersonii.AAC.1
MSASLVGSEMCIRDSFLPTLGAEREIWAPRLLVSAPMREHLRTPGTTQPVSYTHLTLPTICSV